MEARKRYTHLALYGVAIVCRCYIILLVMINKQNARLNIEQTRGDEKDEIISIR